MTDAADAGQTQADVRYTVAASQTPADIRYTGGPGSESPDPPRGIWKLLLWEVKFIEKISSLMGSIGWILAWVVFILGFFNVVTRYASEFFGRDFIYGPAFDYWWMSFGFMFLMCLGYGLKEGVNPRIDFWWAEFSDKRKAWLDLGLHLFLMVPYIFFALRALWPYMLTALGRRRTGEWREIDGWKFWEIWEEGNDAGNLTRGPIKSMLFVGFVLLAIQLWAEILKQVFILRGRKDLVATADADGFQRIE